jgi:hypothetical protein
VAPKNVMGFIIGFILIPSECHCYSQMIFDMETNVFITGNNVTTDVPIVMPLSRCLLLI